MNIQFNIPLPIIFMILVMQLFALSIVQAQSANSSSPVPSPLPSSSPDVSSEPRLIKLEEGLKDLNKKVENKPKDVWDKLSSISGLFSGILVAIIGGLATYLYNERNRSATEAQGKQQLSVLQIQTTPGSAKDAARRIKISALSPSTPLEFFSR